MNIKLGPCHLLGGNTTNDWLKIHPTVAGFIGDLGLSNNAQVDTLLFGRVVDDKLLDGQGFDVNRYTDAGADPTERAVAYVKLLQPSIDSNKKIVIWQGPNEQILRSNDNQENGYTDENHIFHSPAPGTKEIFDQDRKKFMLWYGEFSYQFAKILSAQGKRASIGNWASGQPRPEHNLWRYWGRALQAVKDFGAIECRHDYTAGDVAGLLRVVYDNNEFEKIGFVGVQQVITELGVDVNGKSWRQIYGNDIGRCLKELIYPWLDQVSIYPWFTGALFYCDGGHNDWANYDVSDTDIAKQLATYIPPKEMDVDDQLKTAIRAHARNAIAENQAILDLLPLNWWEKYPDGLIKPSKKSSPLSDKLPLYHQASGTPYETRTVNPATYGVDVYEKKDHFLRVTDGAGAIWTTAESLKAF